LPVALLLPLRIFKSRNVSGANTTVALMIGGFFGMFFLGALYMQRVLGYGPVEVGLAFLPVALLIGTLALGFSARLNTRFGPGTVLVPGLSLGVAALALLTRAPVSYVEFATNSRSSQVAGHPCFCAKLRTSTPPVTRMRLKA